MSSKGKEGRSIAWVFRKVYSGAAGNLTGDDRDTGLVAFGTAPNFLVKDPQSLPAKVTHATGWRPKIANLNYTAFNSATPSPSSLPMAEPPDPVAGVDSLADVFMFFAEQLVQGVVPPLSTAAPVRHAMRIFIEPAVHTVFFSGLDVPVSEENGKPWNFRLVTRKKLQATDVELTIDWDWNRQNTNVDRELLVSLVDELTAQQDSLGTAVEGLRQELIQLRGNA